MKTLAELRLEVELGLWVYPSTNHDVMVWREEANEYHTVSIQRQSEHPWYKLFHDQQRTPVEAAYTEQEKKMMGTGNLEHAYHSFDELLTDWPSLASQPVWSTAKTPERIAFEAAELRAYNARIAQYDQEHPQHPF